LTLFGFRRFLDFVELRQGAILADPLLSLFAPIDLTWITFVLIYSGLLFGLVILSSSPFLLLQTVAAYTILLFFRTVCMYTVPLDPPPGIIPLVCLWLVCNPIVKGGFNPSNGELRSQMKFSSITRADLSEASKFVVAFFLSC
jgi:hypothetical protein